MAKRGTARSLSEDVAARLRAAILDGELQPGDRLQPIVLSKQYDASTTVVREALSALSGERLIRSEAGHGFFVPTIERAEVTDLVEVRVAMESLALRMSMERGGPEWESQVLAAHHLLVRTPRRLPGNGRTTAEWSAAHSRFHAEIVGACGIPILIGMCQQLSAATELYRLWVGSLVPQSARDVEAEHLAILDAIVKGDVNVASELLAEHYRLTARMLVQYSPETSSPLAALTG
jgi:DNA-binding GntR family transcriptional regulator